MNKVLKDNYIYTFSKNNKPALYCDDNDIIDVYTLDCYSNMYRSENDRCKLASIHSNPATGPIYVNGAKPGDVLKVEILNIKVDNVGFICTFKGCGALRDRTELRTKTFEVKDDKVKFNDLTIDINPMIGVIGTAHESLEISSGKSFDCGGNMDSNIITKGSTVYFPVRVDGALLAMGDIHALMGDGEISGTGIEISGVITIKVSIIKNFELNYPVTETKDAWFVNTFGDCANQAIIRGYNELQRLISKAYSWDYTDTCLYMSVQAILSANQACLTHDKYEDEYNGPTFRVGCPKILGKDLIK